MSAPATSPVPEGGILLHVGMHKTGTTALQGMFAAAGDRLLDAGVFYPPTPLGAHHRGARAVTEHRAYRDDAPPGIAEWESVVTAVRGSTSPRVLISSEYLAGADTSQRQRILDDLGPDRVHIVVTVRNFTRVAVSLWQQTLKRGRAATLDEWLERSFRRTDAQPDPHFWARHDPSVVAAAWAELLGADRVTAVVLDERDHDVLPGAFEQLLGLAPGTLSTTEVSYTNRGMTAVECEVIRQVNAALRSQLNGTEYHALIRSGAIRNIVESRTPPDSEPRLSTPDWVADQAVAEGQRVAEALTTSGVRVIGDLGNLTTRVASGRIDAGADFDDVPVDLAVTGLVGIVTRAAAAVRGGERLAPAKRKRSDIRVDELSTAQLARVLKGRVTAGIRRRLS
jgi:hypothetical protein